MGLDQARWPLFLLLVLTVIVPTACLLWFMVQTMESERQAVRHRLGEMVRRQLAAARDRLEARWEDRVSALLEAGGQGEAPGRFAATVHTGLVDGVVILDDRGIPAYPHTDRPDEEELIVKDPTWIQAQDLEFRQRDASSAASAYGDIAEYSVAPGQAGLALLARARCLARSGEVKPAIEILTSTLAASPFRNVRDGAGRLIQLGAMLRSLHLMKDRESATYKKTVKKLTDRLNDYSEPCPLSRRRLFIMKALHSLLSGGNTSAANTSMFPTQKAEELTADYMESHLTRPEQAHVSTFSLTGFWLSDPMHRDRSFLSPCRVRNVWQLVLPDSGMVILFKQDRLQQEMATVQKELALPDDAVLALQPPGAAETGSGEALFQPTGWPHAGWQLTLDRAGGRLLTESADRETTFTLWMGLLFIAATVAVAALMAHLIGRQIRITRLKNDLVATVTHELKTPLASIRLLVDTLLENKTEDPTRTREYLELIARENARLGHLIENFLTFSRMERNKKAFDFAPVHVEEVVNEALTMMGERLESAGFRVECSFAEPLPQVTADSAALVTVLLNLVDNAIKYSAGDRWIAVRVDADEDHVIIEVEDHGMGMTGREIRRIFDRFYQADRSLTRSAGGCGLGLSIVKFMMEAHGGTIEVASRSGEGTIFTLRLPHGTER